jgi:8-oxo-dGTP diphosphatase
MTRDKPVEAVVAIIQRSDRFLFVKRSDYTDAASGYWCPVSGRIEKNETQEEALKREAMEEVGLEVAAVEKVCEIPSADGQFFLHRQFKNEVQHLEALEGS